MAGGREWTTTEIRVIRAGYADGLLVADIARSLNRTQRAVQIKAQSLGIRHKHGSLREAVRLFEQATGRQFVEVAADYHRRKLSRRALADALGINDITRDLKSLVPEELWNTWPHYTVGRKYAVEQRTA